MKNKSNWLKVLAIFAAIAGVAVAVVAFLKKKSEKISEELDFDNSAYFDDEDDILGEVDDDEDTAVDDFAKEAEEIVDSYNFDVSTDEDEEILG